MKKSKYEVILNMYEEEIKEIKKCMEELRKIEIEEDKSKPRFNEEYWFIDACGGVYNDFWNGVNGDNYRFDIGNVFRTEEEAKFEVEYRKVLAELKQFSHEFSYGYRNFYINLSNGSNLSYKYRSNVRIQGIIYFESEEKIKEAIKSVGENRIKKYLFGVG